MANLRSLAAEAPGKVSFLRPPAHWSCLNHPALGVPSHGQCGRGPEIKSPRLQGHRHSRGFIRPRITCHRPLHQTPPLRCPSRSCLLRHNNMFMLWRLPDSPAVCWESCVGDLSLGRRNDSWPRNLPRSIPISTAVDWHGTNKITPNHLHAFKVVWFFSSDLCA